MYHESPLCKMRRGPFDSDIYVPVAAGSHWRALATAKPARAAVAQSAALVVL
jgi:hypothetical protein